MESYNNCLFLLKLHLNKSRNLNIYKVNELILVIFSNFVIYLIIIGYHLFSFLSLILIILFVYLVRSFIN